MYIPEIFYYYDKTNEIEYNRIPQGGETLDISRMARQLPAWKKLKPTDKKKQKTLILTDWTAAVDWKDDKNLDKAKQIILHLLQEGFPVYIWQDGHFISLKTDNLDLLDK